ncbi:zinc finger protein 235 [Scaptodrosophila lebanonensis]|uniref:Zinc finger protein 235 n=1 Tax=Drosophila lebanonensis TaxID=7225 RepID=A0A6J2UD79_DROLE|nr:zinc finger protein 235 [Scaptodrosophila lebanonensis]
MFKSKHKRWVRTAAADSTQSIGTGKMSMCRACLCLLPSPSDAAHDLHSEKDLALKFLACTGRGVDALLPLQDEATQVVLKYICESCYQLVQQFHNFQRMCEESLLNFEKLLLEASPRRKDNEPLLEKHTKDADDVIPTPKEIKNIEEVYIVEDESTKQEQAEHFLASQSEEKVSPPSPHVIVALKRRRGQRRTLSCNLCPQRFYKANLLEAHMKEHRGEKPYTCVHCGKAYARSNLLRSHLQEVHIRLKASYPCPHPNCNKMYRAIRSLKYHINQQHGGRQSSSAADVDLNCSLYICDKCGKSYGSQGHLTRHQWVHVGKHERPFECNHCAQRFYTKQFLADHLVRRHSSAYIQRCKKCGRIFPSCDDLANHMKELHASATPNIWKCDTCHKSFSTRSNLRCHQRVVHACVRPHSCSFCPAKFGKRQCLEHHEMRHTGERAFKCLACKRAFIQKGAYQRHMRAHKKEKLRV